MYRPTRLLIKLHPAKYLMRNFSASTLPESADVVIIGGGSAGCHAFYHLSKRGVKTVLLERAKLTSGTTWHTAGLVWRLRPNDVDIQLLASSRNLLMSLENETGVNPGWIQNGGIFIAHDSNRLDEYKRLSTIGKALGIENHMLSPSETHKLFPLLNPEAFIGSMYSPGDGVVDPAMLCTALTKSGITNGGQLIENCPVNEILIKPGWLDKRKVIGVSTDLGTIKTDCVVNATGVWGRDLIEKHGLTLPLIPMKHAYVVSEPIDGIQGMPNIRDHDTSIYFRIQGSSICMGGYENNPIILDNVDKNLQFGLYELDWSTFESHIAGSEQLCPAFGKAGIKSTICGPESFTPDHKALMGPDPRLDGLFHSCGFNSAGMMFGGGCGEQLAHWIINGRPELHMFAFDIRRFSKIQTENLAWARERSHESYAKNYSKIFLHDQPLAGRNLIRDALHKQMLQYGAVMEEKHGWERPGYFLLDGTAIVQPYDWYGQYGHAKNKNNHYEEKLLGDCKYEISDHHDLIGEEAVTCRTNAAVFNISYFCKFFVTGCQAKKAIDWIFTANFDKPINKTVYTCALNNRGGVEADVTVSIVGAGGGEVHDPILKDQGYYIVAGGSSARHTLAHVREAIKEKEFNAQICDVTNQLAAISIQGPNSREILQAITDYDLSNESLPPYSTTLLSINSPNSNDKYSVRVVRVSFVGELGFELHVPVNNAVPVYNALMVAGGSHKIRNAGYRSLYSLSSEKGYHLWGFDLRSDDTPIEANLGFICRRKGEYKGKETVDRQRSEGIKKRLVFLTLNEHVPIFGLEGVYRDGKPVGFVRRAEYGYTLQKPIIQTYIRRTDGYPIDLEYLKGGKYQVDVMGKLYDATCFVKSPFDPENRRILGDYS